jgi:hypothetical protein
MKIDLSSFKQNSAFYNEINLLVTIKSFDLQAIRKRYLSTKNKKSKRTGSTERRKITEGGVAMLHIKNGRIVSSSILKKMPEPRGIHYFNNIIALSSENRVFIIKNDIIHKIYNPWFSYIHTVNINRQDNNKIIVSSSGYDAIFEYDYINNKKLYEWFAWENGFNHGLDPKTGDKVYLTRKKDEAEYYKNQNIPHIYIDNPEQQTLPTAKRSAFINSVGYDHNDTNGIIATFFHEGAVFGINRDNGNSVKLLDGLNSPHGGFRFDSKIMATSTRGGEVVIGNTNSQLRYDFSKLQGKPYYLSEFEWIQNSIPLGDNIISIDSNRNSFVIFNPKAQLIDIVPFDENWAVQDMIEASPSNRLLQKISDISL